MATPNYEQVRSFGFVASQLKQAAVDEFASRIHDGMSVEDVTQTAVRIAEKYSMLGCELGAQWYDLCSELAGLDVDPAMLPDIDEDGIRAGAESAASRVSAGGNPAPAWNTFLENQVMASIRETGYANLWRDYRRGLAGGRWTRVPVGETCAWCIMLASQGAWYLSEQSALGSEPGHYHSDCDCVAVFHADANDISGYTDLMTYKQMYYDAENARVANRTGRKPYDDELKHRIDKAKAEHLANYAADETDAKWTVYNETLIVMRYQNGLK